LWPLIRIRTAVVDISFGECAQHSGPIARSTVA
jgi:hypothetical protein